MINIVMFCPQFRPVVGGAERQAEKLAIALIKLGCNVTILTPRLDNKSPEKEVVEGLIINRFNFIDLSRKYPYPGVALFNIPYILWQIYIAVRPHIKKADILHCHIASLQTAGAAIAGRLAGVPVILKAAMADQRSDLGEIEKTGSSGRMVALLVRKTISIWVATTTAVEEALLRAGIASKDIVKIPNGVDLPDTNPKYKSLDLVRRFLYLGRLSTNIQRDVPTLIKTFDALAKVFPNLELAIVGGGDLLEETRELAHNSFARNRIFLPGFDKPEKWLDWADCFVLPSRREGLSNSLLEAMAIGLPCIANDIPPNREVLDNGDTGILVPIQDEKALENAMLSLILSGSVARKYSQKAKECVVHNYSINSVAEKYRALYVKLISKSPH